jgi:transketolase N-terminal domain/subunit
MSWILFHEGKFSEAYGYANAAIHGNDCEKVRDHLSAINGVVHNPVATSSLHADDQKIRTFPLGPANGHAGVAFYTLLLADSKVVDSTLEKSANTNALSNGVHVPQGGQSPCPLSARK